MKKKFSNKEKICHSFRKIDNIDEKLRHQMHYKNAFRDSYKNFFKALHFERKLNFISCVQSSTFLHEQVYYFVR